MHATGSIRTLLALLALCPAALPAQAPVDRDGDLIDYYEDGASETGNEGIPLLSATELEDLVGPVALYPDDLLAIVLPASTYPLQVVQAARFLEDLESDPGLEPDPDWDDSIVALINYPEVVELLNEDLDWTWRLGEAVVAQQTDVVAAVERFRDRAYAAGNLKSDGRQNIRRNGGVIEITPVEEDVIYVPYYEPERVVVYQPRSVYYYYPRPCPVYYYPYPASYAFHRGYFWGVTTAFSIGWLSDSVRVIHSSYYGHPYYGHYYRDYWWYRRPSITVHNTWYVTNNVHVSSRLRHGDHWRPRATTRLRISDQRITRNRYYPGVRSQADGRAAIPRSESRVDSRVERQAPRPSADLRGRIRSTDSDDRAVSRGREDGGIARSSGRERPSAGVPARREGTLERSPTRERQPPAARREAPAVGRDAPDLRREAPAVRREAPAIRRESPAVRREAPAVRREAPTIRRESPAVRREAPAVRREAPAIRRESPAVRREAPAVRREAPTIRRESPAVRREAPTVRREAGVPRPVAREPSRQNESRPSARQSRAAESADSGSRRSVSRGSDRTRH